MQIADLLEDRARELAKRVGLGSKDASPASLLEQQIALTLAHMESVRQVHTDQLKSLLRSECSVDTDLMQLDCYNPVQFRFMFKIRDNLKNKVLQIDKERRHVARDYQTQIRELQEQLLSQLGQLLDTRK